MSIQTIVIDSGSENFNPSIIFRLFCIRLVVTERPNGERHGEKARCREVPHWVDLRLSAISGHCEHLSLGET
jgi:hypothetical protein